MSLSGSRNHDKYTHVKLNGSSGETWNQVKVDSDGNLYTTVSGGSVSTYLYGPDSISGTQTQVKTSDGYLTVMAKDYFVGVAEGDIDTTHKPFSKLGYNGDIDDVEEDLWSVGGKYVFPVSAQQMEVVSASDSDTQGGTGATSVIIKYLDNTYTETTEVVLLTGTTPVPTVATNILRINSMRVASAGSSGAPAGNIDIRNLSDTPIYGRINAGQHRMRQAIFTVPLGKTLYVNTVLSGSGNSLGNRYTRWAIRANYDEIVGQKVAWMVAQGEWSTQDGSIQLVNILPAKIPQTIDVVISAVSDSGTASAICSCGIRGWTE